MLSLLSMAIPSQPLMLFVSTAGVPWSPVVLSKGILTIQSNAVLHTNMAVASLLNSTPFAPKGGIPKNPPVDVELHVVGSLAVVQAFGLRRSSSTHLSAWPQALPVSFQMMPLNESEMYVLPA